VASKNIVEVVIKATDQASGKLRGVTSVIGKIGTVATVAAAAFVAAGVVIGRGAYKLAKDAMPIEGITKAFEGMTKSYEGGSRAMLKALKASSLGMVSNTKLMKSFNLATQLVSKDFAENLPEAMEYLTKVAAATGEDMDYMMESMVRGIGRLSPMILDNLGIQVDLTQAYEDFAEANGLVATELTKTEQQTALMNQVMEKLMKNTADMPEVVGTAAHKFGVLRTQFQNLKEEVGLMLLPMLSELVGALSEFVEEHGPAIVEAVGGIIKWFTDWGNYILNVLIPSIASIAPAMDTMRDITKEDVEEIRNAVIDNENEFTNWERIVYFVGTGIASTLIRIRDKGKEVAEALAPEFEIAATNMEDAIRTFVDNATPILWELYHQAVGIVQMIIALFQSLGDMWFSAPNLIGGSGGGSGGGASRPQWGSSAATSPWRGAEGGQFIVPGSGSGDRATMVGLAPGELVTVTKKDDVRGGGGRAINITLNLNSFLSLADMENAERVLVPIVRNALRQAV